MKEINRRAIFFSVSSQICLTLRALKNTVIMYSSNGPIDYLPILITVIVAGGFVSLTMFVTHFLGPKRKNKVKLDTFECGIEAQGNARIPFSVKYFLAAILFVLFDVEVIFLYPWAVDFKSLGTPGF